MARSSTCCFFLEVFSKPIGVNVPRWNSAASSVVVDKLHAGYLVSIEDLTVQQFHLAVIENDGEFQVVRLNCLFDTTKNGLWRSPDKLSCVFSLDVIGVNGGGWH